jgi:hypothetical protein
MMLILNRLRGTNGVWSKAIGLLLALVVQIAFGNPYVSIAVGLGYIIGESFGWGLWVGSIAERADGYSLYLKGEREGANNGIHWLASHIVEPTKETWLNYCRVAMVIRGFYWYVLTITPLYFVGFSPYLLLGLIVFLSFGFMLSYELAYYLAPKLNIKWLEFNSGWTLGEGIVGLTQDIAFLVLIGASLWHYL